MTTELERDLLDSKVSVPIAGDADPIRDTGMA